MEFFILFDQNNVICIMQGPAQDEVIAKLRSAFLEIVQEYKVYTEEEKKKVNLSLNG